MIVRYLRFNNPPPPFFNAVFVPEWPWTQASEFSEATFTKCIQFMQDGAIKSNESPETFGSYDSILNCLPALLSRWGNSRVHSVRVLSSQRDSLRQELVMEWSGLSLKEGQTAGRVTVPVTSNSQRSLLSSNFIHCLWTNYHMKINYSALHDRKRR